MALYNPKPKPIFVVRMPSRTSSEAMRVMSEDAKKNMKDYHVLVIKDMISEEKNIKFEVFNADSFREIEFEELKKRLLILAEDKFKYI
jgi:hypothetical protein